jgi:hypothetical protein
MQKWLWQQSKDFYVSGFDSLVKRWDNCINVGGGNVAKQMLFFSVSNITYFAFYIHLWLIYWASLYLKKLEFTFQTDGLKIKQVASSYIFIVRKTLSTNIFSFQFQVFSGRL